MTPDHVIDVKEAVEYLQQWVKGFDQFIEEIMQPKENDDADV